MTVKHFILTILFGLFFCAAFGQTYHPLIKPNKFWDVQYSGFPQICLYSSGYRYFFNGDTTISGKLYNVIWGFHIYNINSGPYCPPFAIDTNNKWNCGIFMREDTIERKVYVYNDGINSDDLFYDFNLAPGDTLKSDYSGQPIISSVSDTTLLTGDTMRIFYLDNGEYYIESLGGSKGFCFPMMLLVQGCSDPKCIIDNDIQLWGNECFPTNTGLGEQDINNVTKVCPNPATDFIELKLENFSSSFFNIYDLTGRRILTQTNYNNKEIVDISFMTAGTYIYKVVSSDKEIMTGKLIIIK